MSDNAETCPRETCVYKAVAAKLAYLITKKEIDLGSGLPASTEVEYEWRAAQRLVDMVELERLERIRCSAVVVGYYGFNRATPDDGPDGAQEDDS